MPPNNVPDSFSDELFRVLASSPFMILTAAIACGSGHLWAYMIFSYFSKKERKILESFYGRTALGLIWFALIIIPVHLISNGNLLFELSSITNALPSVIIFGLATQAMIFIVVYYVCKRGVRKSGVKARGA
jgi:threonine/homoserine efflux transporter RhtA